MQLSREEKQAQKETSRIEAFSDGVFCVAITLLAIEIGVEAKNNTTNIGLTNELIALWPKYLAYFISFVNVLLAWIGHHSLFKNLRNTDNFVMICNGVLLMLVALVPYPAKTLGIYLNTAALKSATIFYTGYFVLVSITFKLLWHAASRNKSLLIHGISEEQINEISKNENIGLICNSTILALAFINSWAALISSFIMWIYWMLPGKQIGFIKSFFSKFKNSLS